MCVCVYHIFFIHVSVDGHLGCFRALAIVNSAAMDIKMNLFFIILKFILLKWLIYDVVLVSGVQQSDAVRHIYMCVCVRAQIYMHIFFIMVF